ncbi:MAG: ferredoxin [Cytophagaceae bacterium]|nr:ferredoxin [Cytophagaceae bacterium]
MSLAALDRDARATGLAIRGAFHPAPGNAVPEGAGTLILLGPDEPGFWPEFRRSPEYSDDAPPPLDRWSRRVIGALAARWGGMAVFPADGPPWPPFLSWAARSGQAFPSPIGLYVHARAGLWISYRGAVALPGRLELPQPSAPPCPACAGHPCASACPVGALSTGAPYDVARCQSYLRTEAGRDCRERGCLARRACPISATLPRQDEQSAFHMAAFMEDWPTGTAPETDRAGKKGEPA